ncbi:MAG: DUF1266 domain-containing protein [Clostridia bacterium]|nr:DUF1266 domain-containing protein [Clostridia bacterium]
MVDIEEMMRRAQEASEGASRWLNESIEKSQKIAEQMQADTEKAIRRQEEEAGSAGQVASNQQRQVEILGQMFSPETMAQMADTDALIQKTVAEATALGMEGMMGQLFGEDMGVIAAALETLEMEETDGDNKDEDHLDLEMEEELYHILNEKLALLERLPELESCPYEKNDPRWGKFGILLSGIISNLNDHQLDGLDVEEHIPVMEQQVVSLVRRSWGINGRSELLDTIRYLAREGYTLRYQMYCEAASPEELVDETDDEEELASAGRGWRFAQQYKAHFSPGFMTGWDVGRAAMLARWGCYLGWLTEGEATGILWDLSQRAAEELHSWREFAQSYLFGGLIWKLLCGDAAAESYLGFLADAATDLLTGHAEENEGQWKDCPWPAARKIGFQA